MSERHVSVVAVIIAVGITLAFNLITFGVLWDAIRSQGPGLSDNATQVLTGLGGGLIGILGGIVGYRAGLNSGTDAPLTQPDDWPTRELPPRGDNA